jgi:hypothetical protein
MLITVQSILPLWETHPEVFLHCSVNSFEGASPVFEVSLDTLIPLLLNKSFKTQIYPHSK